LSYERQVRQRHIRRYRDRPARTEETVRYQLHVTPDPRAIEQQQRLVGWRLYALTVPVAQLSLSQAVTAYRGAPAVERDFSRLKGRPLGLRPADVQREDHLLGLVRLLSVALSVLTLTEFVARRALPLAFDPGSDAQMDWGEGQVILAGQPVTVQLFLMNMKPLPPKRRRVTKATAATCWP